MKPQETENQDLKNALSSVLDAHARERAALEGTCHNLQKALEEGEKFLDHQDRALKQTKGMIQDRNKDLLEAQTDLADALRSIVWSNEECIRMQHAYDKTLTERDEQAKKMLEMIRVLREAVEEQKGTIEELRKKTKPYWVFDEHRY